MTKKAKPTLNKHLSRAVPRKQAIHEPNMQIDNTFLTPDEWIEKYGRDLGINSSDYVRQMCRGDQIGRSHTIAQLPEGWEAKKFGNAWMIFKSQERKP